MPSCWSRPWSTSRRTRYLFYLAQSWRDAGEPDKAIAAYIRRAAMGGWEEEVFYARYQVGLSAEQRRRVEQNRAFAADQLGLGGIRRAAPTEDRGATDRSGPP